jgi:hypothetical protein
VARDALEPGAGGTYPAFPRRPDGRPDFERAGWPPGSNAAYDADPSRAPSELSRMRNEMGEVVVVDLALRDADGRAVNPPQGGTP